MASIPMLSSTTATRRAFEGSRSSGLTSGPKLGGASTRVSPRTPTINRDFERFDGPSSLSLPSGVMAGAVIPVRSSTTCAAANGVSAGEPAGTRAASIGAAESTAASSRGMFRGVASRGILSGATFASARSSIAKVRKVSASFFSRAGATESLPISTGRSSRFGVSIATPARVSPISNGCDGNGSATFGAPAIACRIKGSSSGFSTRGRGRLTATGICIGSGSAAISTLRRMGNSTGRVCVRPRTADFDASSGIAPSAAAGCLSTTAIGASMGRSAIGTAAGMTSGAASSALTSSIGRCRRWRSSSSGFRSTGKGTSDATSIWAGAMTRATCRGSVTVGLFVAPDRFIGSVSRAQGFREPEPASSEGRSASFV